jgi:hypothetical protein
MEGIHSVGTIDEQDAGSGVSRFEINRDDALSEKISLAYLWGCGEPVTEQDGAVSEALNPLW